MAGDCFTKVDVAYGDHIHYIKVYSRQGKSTTLGGSAQASSTHTWDFGNECIKGVFGTVSNNFDKIGFYHGPINYYTDDSKYSYQGCYQTASSIVGEIVYEDVNPIPPFKCVEKVM